MDKQERGSRKLIAVVMLALVAAVGFLVVTQSKADGNEAPAAEEKADATQAEKGDDEEKETAPIPIEVTAAERGTIAAYLSASANLVAENHVKVLAESEGRVAEIRVEEGQQVAKGQVLVALQRDDAEIALDKAKARAANAELAWQRAQAMHGQSLLSKQDLDRLSMERTVAQQELAEAEWVLSKRFVRAPFAGRVTERMVGPGQRVKPGDELFAVADFHLLVARIYLPEKDVRGLSEGQRVTIASEGGDLGFAGSIRQISPVVDTATGTVKVTVEATRPPAAVRPGGFVTIEIERERRAGVVVLPRDAVLRELKSAHVFVATDGVAKKVPVELGLEEGDRVEVRSGLAGGERVVTAGQGGLKDGAPVKVIPPAA